MKCGEINRQNGLPCKRNAGIGFTKCSLHGGHNVTAKIKAEQMLAQARLPACEALFDIIDQWQAETCGTCGYPKTDTDTAKVIIRAAQVILDRTGVGPRATLEVTKQTDGDLDLDLLTDQEMARMDFLLAELKALKDGVRVRLGLGAQPHVVSVLPATPDQEM
jgi:hypothetical protein